MSTNCAIKVYRLRDSENNPITADTEFASLERFLVVGKFVCKRVVEEHVDIGLEGIGATRTQAGGISTSNTADYHEYVVCENTGLDDKVMLPR